MTQDNAQDFLNYDDSGKPVIPSGLNILTILTFIGCSLGLLFNLATPWLLNVGKEALQKKQNSGSGLTPKEMEGLEGILKSEANMFPLIAISIVGIILCFVGALWMRKLKKDGYWLYVAGQVVPIIGGLILMGMSQFNDWKGYVGLCVPLLFILLYTMQRKYLVR
jgi:hypothetical protein